MDEFSALNFLFTSYLWNVPVALLFNYVFIIFFSDDEEPCILDKIWEL